MDNDIDMTDPTQVAMEYLDVQRRIDDLEGRAAALKQNLQVLLKPDTLAPEDKGVWNLGDAHVAWVKGRKTESLDKKALRKELLLAGVEIEVVEKSFEKATTTKIGAPHFRITEGNGEVPGEAE